MLEEDGTRPSSTRLPISALGVRRTGLRDRGLSGTGAARTVEVSSICEVTRRQPLPMRRRSREARSLVTEWFGPLREKAKTADFPIRAPVPSRVELNCSPRWPVPISNWRVWSPPISSRTLLSFHFVRGSRKVSPISRRLFISNAEGTASSARLHGTAPLRVR